MQHSRNNTALLERPLTARSVIASLLLGMHPPCMEGGRLVQWCELFDIAPGTARVALSRMAERGELSATDGVYELAGRVRSRQAAQDWSVAPDPAKWDGQWDLAVVTAEARSAAERAALRDAMRRARYAELREGVWARPDNLPRASAPEDAWAVIDAQCGWWHGRPDAGARGERVLAEELFATRAWAERARVLLRRAGAVTRALQGGDHGRLADAFVVGAATLQHVRNDPLLPTDLLPAAWPGGDLRRAYRDYQRAFAAATAAWFRETNVGARR
ncbi:MAG: putative transcriptional regulator, PaaX family [Actinomycetia bacterium]|nr:putative transcriptional regulator, PaaX family [Actinomycetes bacterium]